MTISRNQLRALDAVSLNIFLDRVTCLAQAELPDDQPGTEALRRRVGELYDEAIALRHRTERSIAAFILEKLNIHIDEKQ